MLLVKEETFIYSYSRAQAIEDGVLVDVTERAGEAGIKFPTALTSELWHRYIVPSEELEDYGQSIDGRLWDLLCLFRLYARKCSSSVLYFEVYFQMPDEELAPVKVKSVCGPGDSAEPVITIMLPWED